MATHRAVESVQWQDKREWTEKEIGGRGGGGGTEIVCKVKAEMGLHRVKKHIPGLWGLGWGCRIDEEDGVKIGSVKSKETREGSSWKGVGDVC